MVTVFDVAKYILEDLCQSTHMKLQKLLYYSQSWSLVWDEEPLFPEAIEAWANGPVVPEVYQALKGRFRVTPDNLTSGDSSQLSVSQRETVDAVLTNYGKKSAQWLSDLSHMEDPWKNARQGYAPGQLSSEEITPASLAEYYGSLA